MNLPADFSAEDRLATAWLRRMADRDVEALNALYAAYHIPLLGLFRAILRDSFEAEEVLQDTFVRAYQRADRFDPEAGAPFVWLATIGKRLAIDRLRRRRARPELPPDSREHPGHSGDNTGDNGEQTAHRQLEYSWVYDRLTGLSESQRTTIELAFFHGYTHHEIATLLGRPLGTVKSDLQRGLLKLRKAYLEAHD